MPLSRSAQMSRIHSENTSPERVLCAELMARGVCFDRHARTPAGRPDLVVATARVAIFIDGCFWHGCPVHYVRPRTRTEFWSSKLLENTTRDLKQTGDLEALGWRVVRAWEHEVFIALPEVVARVERALRGEAPDLETSWRVVRVDVVDADTNLERRHMVSLRDEREEKSVEEKRYTTKWKKPRARKEHMPPILSGSS
jgi:DNA mismatch endonuclease, patch repair protein